MINEQEFSRKKQPCTFLPLIVRNIHAKNQKNPLRGYPGKVVTNERRTTLGIRTLTSTDVENSTPLTGNILTTEDASEMRFSR